MQLTTGDTALVLTDPQNDFLSPEGVTWEPAGPTPSSPRRRPTSRSTCSPTTSTTWSAPSWTCLRRRLSDVPHARADWSQATGPRQRPNVETRVRRAARRRRPGRGCRTGLPRDGVPGSPAGRCRPGAGVRAVGRRPSVRACDDSDAQPAIVSTSSHTGAVAQDVASPVAMPSAIQLDDGGPVSRRHPSGGAQQQAVAAARSSDAPSARAVPQHRPLSGACPASTSV